MNIGFNEVRYVTESDMVVAVDRHGNFSVPAKGAKVDFNGVDYSVVDVQYRRATGEDFELTHSQTTVILRKIGSSSKLPLNQSAVFNKN